MFRTHHFISAILALILIPVVGLAQGPYLSAHGGYGFGSGTQSLGTSSTTSSREGVYGFLGEGLKFGAAGGYMFSSNLGVEFDASYWSGRTFEMKETENLGTSTYSLTQSQSGSGFVMTPSVVISSGIPAITPYAKLGIVFGIMKVTDDLSVSAPGYVPTESFTQEETGGLALGYSGAIGVLFSAGSTADLFVEATVLSVTYSPSQVELTRYLEDGVDVLHSVSNKTITLEESVPVDSRTSSLSVRRPFSSIGLSAGLRFNL